MKRQIKKPNRWDCDLHDAPFVFCLPSLSDVCSLSWKWRKARMAAPQETAKLLLRQKLQTEWCSTSYTADRSRRNSINLPRWLGNEVGDERAQVVGWQQSQLSQCFGCLNSWTCRSISKKQEMFKCLLAVTRKDGRCFCVSCGILCQPYAVLFHP